MNNWAILIGLEESLFKLNEYYDYDDIEYKGIRDIENLFNGVAFNQSTDEDYYQPIKTKSASDGNSIEYQSKGLKDERKEHLDMIRPYLSDRVNDYKIPKTLTVHLSKEIQFGEWEIQLTMSINFIFSKDSDETGNMHTEITI